MSGERTDRFYDVKDSDQRHPFERDRDRLLYSKEFRRLSGVTQVVCTDESYLYHERLSHTIKVAQVGRRLAEHLVREDESDLNIEEHIDPDVVETAALAHDLGHPPFGHAVEEKLDELLRNRGVDQGFEANAQAFRIVVRTSPRDKRYRGMNLTRGSLNAILKYPWHYGEGGNHNKWGYYKRDKEYFDFARQIVEHGQGRTLEAQIMDWADDLAYAIHDVIDFYKSGLIPFDQLLTDSDERDSFIDSFYEVSDVGVSDLSAEEFLDELEFLAADEIKTPFNGTDKERAGLNEFGSKLIQKYMGIDQDDHIVINESEPGYNLKVHPDIENQIECLKYMTRYYVISNSSLRAQQYGQLKVIETLFNTLVECSAEDHDYSNVIPHPYRERISNLDNLEADNRIRIIADLISGLTEQQALELYKRITGDSMGSLQNQITR